VTILFITFFDSVCKAETLTHGIQQAAEKTSAATTVTAREDTPLPASSSKLPLVALHDTAEMDNDILLEDIEPSRPFVETLDMSSIKGKAPAVPMVELIDEIKSNHSPNASQRDYYVAGPDSAVPVNQSNSTSPQAAEDPTIILPVEAARILPKEKKRSNSPLAINHGGKRSRVNPKKQDVSSSDVPISKSRPSRRKIPNSRFEVDDIQLSADV